MPSKLTIRRTIPTRKYTIPSEYFGNEIVQDTLAQAMIGHLPYILYFDDFRDKIAERIEIPQTEVPSSSEWFDILQELFTHTDKSYSLYKLANMEVRQRKSVLSHVQRRLNETLTREWQSFRLDDRDALKINIEFAQELASAQTAQQPPTPPGPCQRLLWLLSQSGITSRWRLWKLIRTEMSVSFLLVTEARGSIGFSTL